MKQNRFFIEGEGNIKYSHNNGHIANDPKLAVRYFLNALEKIPSLIEKYEKENEKISKDLPVLQEVVHSTWRKENELKDLKTELATLDRKIQLSLKPVEQSEDTPEDNLRKNNAQNDSGRLNPNDVVAQTRPIPEKLQQAKEAMGDRFIIGSVPKYNNENQSKRFKI